MAYKTFANGFPLPASDLNNFLMNQSVIVFADSAARTTAIPSPVTGMLTYLVDTAAYESWNGSAFVALAEEPDLTSLIPKSTVTTAQDLIVADGASSVTRLGVGTDDQVLSVVAGEVAWADASGGGGWTELATTSMSTSTVSFSSISQDYTDLRVVISNCRISSTGQLYFALKNSAGTAQEAGVAHFTPAASIGNNRNTIWTATNGMGPDSGVDIQITMTLTNYVNSGSKSIFVGGTNRQSGSLYPIFEAGNVFGTDAIHEVEFTSQNGSRTFTQGTMTIYGM